MKCAESASRDEKKMMIKEIKEVRMQFKNTNEKYKDQQVSSIRDIKINDHTDFTKPIVRKQYKVRSTLSNHH